MESLEAREQDLIQHIRTAGLQKRREIALVDEVLELRKEKRKLLTSLMDQIVTLTAEKTELTTRCTEIIADAKEQLTLIKTHFEEKLQIVQGPMTQQLEDLKAENKLLLDQNSALKGNQLTMTEKYSRNVQLLDAKIQELVKIQKVTESTLRQDIEATVSRRIAGELELQHEAKILKLKEALRAIAERESDLKAVNQEQQLALKAARSEIEIYKERSKLTDSNSLGLQNELYQCKLEGEKLRIKAEGLEGVVIKTKMEVTAAQTRAAADAQVMRTEHEKQLETIAQRVKQTIQSKDTQLRELQERLVQSERARGALEQSFADISRGLSRSS